MKAGFISHKKVINMNFKKFERLESFYLMTIRIEEINNEPNSSFKGKNKPVEKSSGGLTIRNDDTFTRN